MEVTEKDLKGEIEGFPIEVVQKMIERQVEQGNKADVSIFTQFKIANQVNGGFTWSKTPEGADFWIDVIGEQKFKTFFEKYPIKSHSKNNTLIKIKTKEIKLNFKL